MDRQACFLLQMICFPPERGHVARKFRARSLLLFAASVQAEDVGPVEDGEVAFGLDGDVPHDADAFARHNVLEFDTSPKGDQLLLDFDPFAHVDIAVRSGPAILSLDQCAAP